MGPLSSPSFRQGHWGHIPFFDFPAIAVHRDGMLAQSRNSSLRAITCMSRSSPVCPGCHQPFPVVTRSIPECQMANASMKDRNSYHGAYRQGIIRGVSPSPNFSAQTPYVLRGWAKPAWSVIIFESFQNWSKLREKDQNGETKKKFTFLKLVLFCLRK